MKNLLLFTMCFAMVIITSDLAGQNTLVVTVFEDLNANGTDDGDPTIPGVSTNDLQLWQDVNNNGAVDVGTDVEFMHDNGAGMYTFGAGNVLPDDNYILLYNETPGSFHVTEMPAPVGAPDMNNDMDPVLNAIAFNLTGAGVVTNIDVGLYLAADIGDQIWEDVNGNGVNDAGEPGIGGVNVTLLDAATLTPVALDADMNPLTNPATTAAGTGNYEFLNLIPGDYVVEFSLPAPVGAIPWFPTIHNVHTDATDPDSDSDADPNNMLRSHVITLNSNEIDEEERIDAGFYVPVEIGDFVFCDINGNGIYEPGIGETGVRNIPVMLLDAGTMTAVNDANGNPYNIMTDNTGSYLFELVPPGEYILEFSGLPANFVWTRPDQGADDCFDSDIDSNTGQTMAFTIESQNLTGLDLDCFWAGTYQLVTIEGTVFFDDDMSMTLNGTEGGPGGVLVNLIDDMGTIVDDQTTTAGEFSFPSNPGIQLPPGDYQIQIDATAFDPGGPLNGATPCPGFNNADDMVDDDDNGSDGVPAESTIFTVLSNCSEGNPPIVSYVDFCYFFNCNTPNALALDACDLIQETDIICDINTLASFCAIMPSANSPGVQPSPLCPGGGGAHNISWFAFVAYGGDYSVTVTPTGCQGSTTGDEGVQIGLYTDCTFTDAAFCNPGCSTAAVTFDSDDLEEGQTYYFFIDGCSSSVCSYEVSITGTPEEPNVVPDDLCIDDNGVQVCDDTDNVYCPDVPITFDVAGLDLDIDYTWSITASDGGIYSGDAAPMTTEDILDLTFDTEGTYTVCVNNVTNGCQNWSGSFCRVITIATIADEVFDDIMLCDEDDFMETMLMPSDPNGDGNTGWQGPTNNFTFGTNTLPVTQLDGCMYEQEVELIQFPASDKGSLDSIVCRDDLPLTIDGIQYTEAAFGGTLVLTVPDLLLVNSTDINGCDSIIDLRIEILDIFMGSISAGVCLPGEGVILDFSFDPSLTTDDPNAVFTYEWLDPANNPLPDDYDGPGDPALDNIAPTGQSGIYTLVVTIELNGKSCERRYTIDIDYDDLLPQMPTITGNNSICESDSIQTYTAGNIDPNDNVFNYIWDAPAGVQIISGGDVNDDMIEINWAGTSGGDLTLTVVNGCGNSEDNPITVTLVPILTPAFTATTEVCVDSSATIMYMGDQTDIDSYMWDFDGGTVNNATGGMGPGPHEVSWGDDTDRTVRLTVMHGGGCMSTEVTQIVTLVERLTPPAIMCDSETGQVTFSWDIIAGTVEGDYSVDVTTGQGGTLNGNEYTITGLAVEERVDITLTILTNDACVSVSTLGSCIAQNCTPPVVSVSAPNDVIEFCLNGSDQSFDLVGVVPDTVTGMGTFMGTGIIDTLAGTFDPDSAAVGPNTIFYSYLTDDGCTAGSQIVIQVNETPLASFTTDNDTICITESVTVTYDGTAGINANTYETSDGQTILTSNPTITFTQTGEQTISLVVEKDNCTSQIETRTVFVEEELDPISVSCSMQNLNDVEFGWNAVDGATGYLVEIVDEGGTVLNMFTTTDLTYAEGGLNPGDSVIIQVTVLTDSRCGGSTDTQSCIAMQCPTNLVVTVEPVDDICVDQTTGLIDLTASLTGDDGTGTLVWQGDGVVNGNQFDPTAVSEGTIDIMVEYIENGCGGYLGSTTINVTQTPTASFDAMTDPICAGDTVAITYTGSQLPGQTIDWSMSDVQPTLISGDDYEVTFPDAGTFDIILNVTNGDCDTAPDMVTITVEEQWGFSIGDSCMPTDTSVTFTWTEDPCATGYEIFIDSVSQGIQTEATYTESGLMPEQEVEIIVLAISGCACGDVIRTMTCEAMACVQVSLDVSALGGETDFCLVEGLPTVDVLAVPTGNTPDGVGVFSGDGVDPMTGTFDPMVAGVGEHKVYYTYTEPAGCEVFVDSITFNIFDLPAVSADFLPIDCYADSFTMLTISPVDGDGNYTLTANDDPVDLTSEVAAGTYDILVTDGNGCSDMTDVTITIPAEPIPTISGAEELLAGETSTYAIQQSIFTGQAIDSIVWTANDVVVCDDPACFSLVNQAPMENTTYTVTVFYNDGCSVTDTFEVEVREPDPIFTVDIPNIFAPNGSGANTEWKIYTGDVDVVVSNVKIMDRWGNLVFSVDGPYNPATVDVTWDGTLNNKKLQPGVYVYMVEYTQDDRLRIRNGDITIIE